MSFSSVDDAPEDDIHPTQDAWETEVNIYEEIKAKLGSLDRKSFEDELFKIYKSDENELNEIRCSLYDYAKSENSDFPEGCLIKRVNRGSGVCVTRKYVSDIYCLFSFIEGTISATVLQTQVMSKASIRSRKSGCVQVDISDADDTIKNRDRPVADGNIVGDEDVTVVAMILSNIQELKQIVEQSNKDLQGKVEDIECKYNKEMSELKSLCKQKSAQIERLESVIDDMKDRETKLRAEVKLMKQHEKTTTSNHEQMKQLQQSTINSLQGKLNLLESKLNSINSKLHDIQREGPSGKAQRNPSSQVEVQQENASPRIDQHMHTQPQTFAAVVASNSPAKTPTVEVATADVERNIPNVHSRNINIGTEPLKIPSIVTGNRCESFSGVTRPTIKRAALSNVYLDRTVEQMINCIYSHADERNVNLTFVRHITTRDSRYGETATFRLNVQPEDYDKIMSEGFWPDDVRCKEWFSPAQRDTYKKEQHHSRNGARSQGADRNRPLNWKQNYFNSNYGSDNRSYNSELYHQYPNSEVNYRNRFEVLSNG